MPAFDVLIEEQGGFGRYQKTAFFIISVTINMTGILIYNLGYLLLIPKYDCTRNGINVPYSDNADSDY